jgi:peptidoglycan/xylan/chitin deacetylase (PgdA/CDA1 family)
VALGLTATALGAAALPLALLTQPRWVARAAANCRSVVFSAPASGRRQIALTFDDGPDPATTPALLAVLRRHDARATFFFIGSRAEAHPALVAEVAAGGHEIGNHLWLDRASWLSRPATFAAHLSDTRPCWSGPPVAGPGSCARPPAGSPRP